MTFVHSWYVILGSMLAEKSEDHRDVNISGRSKPDSSYRDPRGLRRLYLPELPGGRGIDPLRSL